MKKKTITAIAVILVSCGEVVIAQETFPPPEDPTIYFAEKANTTIRIDRKLSESDWNNAHLINEFIQKNPARRWKIEVHDTLNNSQVVSKNQAINYKDEYEQLERISEAFSCGPLSSVAFPFENLYDGERYVQFRIFRTDAIDNMLEKHAAFWARWAFVQGSNPAIIISVMEYENQLDRYRGYGYLYGYPDHAVDFFVEAAKKDKATGEFVEREFINLPVVSEESGRFVYAVKEGHDLTSSDEKLREKAQANVDLYLEKVDFYRKTDGSIDNATLLRNIYLENGWIN